MVAGLKAKVRHLADICGPHANARVRDVNGELVYRITCRVCESFPGARWTTYKPDHDNDWRKAINRWNRHILTRHRSEPPPASIEIELEWLNYERNHPYGE